MKKKPAEPVWYIDPETGKYVQEPKQLDPYWGLIRFFKYSKIPLAPIQDCKHLIKQKTFKNLSKTEKEYCKYVFALKSSLKKRQKDRPTILSLDEFKKRNK